jgi:drug/metabolite transporter (DMT)-like permease
MFYVVLAALSGLVWGIGDFAGGKATQKAAALPVAWMSKLVSLPLLAVYIGVTYVPIQPASLIWGASAGACGMVGLITFYRALSGGAMTVVAPITAVTSASIPVVFGLASGEQPSPTRLAGVVCALVAIALVSLSPTPVGQVTVVTRRLIMMSGVSGAFFALFFILMSTASKVAGGSAGLWPSAAAQLAAIVFGAVLMLITRPRPWPAGPSMRWTLVAGPFDMSANALYLLATRDGDLSVVAPLAALYPVTTVILALVVDRERLRGIQVAGLALALLALVLVNR